MDASDLLLEKARDYEILAASFAERASFAEGNAASAVGFTVAAIVLREVAQALDEAA